MVTKYVGLLEEIRRLNRFGYSANMIASELNCDVELVVEFLEDECNG